MLNLIGTGALERSGQDERPRQREQEEGDGYHGRWHQPTPPGMPWVRATSGNVCRHQSPSRIATMTSSRRPNPSHTSARSGDPAAQIENAVFDVGPDEVADGVEGEVGAEAERRQRSRTAPHRC